MKNHKLKYQASRRIAALKKMCAMILAWVCKMVCKDTPVLMAHNSFAKSGKTYALAATMPFMAMPIQEVPLLSWTVAHETVNERNNLIASTDEDLYLGLLNEDPYTSDQQRQRDKYELNDTDWYSVSFEQVDGTSKCHFALHDDWIKKQGYETEKVVILNLPEQGINGPFRVTAIKHIIPQKKPSDDAGDGYDWKPVTGLFEHQSNQVYTINFDNGESLGVTYQHPIFSTTANDWKLAGELEIGEEVLTKSGNTKVVSSTKKDGSETVYNLEVKELHNFLVGESGVVVHNCYPNICKLTDWLKNPLIKGRKPKNFSKRGQNVTTNSGYTVKMNDYGFPDFTPHVKRKANGEPYSFTFKPGELSGDHTTDFKAINKKMGLGDSKDAHLNQFPDHTWHHHEDGKTLMLVPKALNNPQLGGLSHTGGKAIIEHNLEVAAKNLNDMLVFPSPVF